MFFDGPKDHLHTKHEDDIKTLSELFPQYRRGEIIDALERNNGEVAAASNWLVNKVSESNLDHHEISPVQSPLQPRMRFACGSCSTILSTELPSPDASGDHRPSTICPTCGIENIIPTEPAPHIPEPQPHYSSWMYLNPSTPSQSSYSHQNQINQNDVLKVMELFPECSQIQIEEALRVAHGDVDLACNWILAHNEYPESSGPSTTYYHPPVPVACVIHDRNTPMQSSLMKVSCGNCSHIMSIVLPISPIQPGSQLSGQCPQCGMMNIIPLRKMSRAVIF
jgi:hypothetical protein